MVSGMVKVTEKIVDMVGQNWGVAGWIMSEGIYDGLRYRRGWHHSSFLRH
jgi:hypothetical protein